MATVVPFTPPSVPSVAPPPSPADSQQTGNATLYKKSYDDPGALADDVLKNLFTDPWGRRTLVHYEKEWYQHTGKQYDKLAKETLEAKVWQRTEFIFDTSQERVPPTVSIARVRNVIGALQSRCHIANVPLNHWLPSVAKRGGDAERQMIAFANGLVDRKALLEGGRVVVEPHTPAWFSLNCLPYAYDPDAKCSNWLKFLARVLEDDPQRIRLLAQWYGVVVFGGKSRQMAASLVGPTASGKSTALRVLVEVAGPANVTAISLETLFTEPYELWETYGKLVNVSDEGEHFDPKAEPLLKSFIAGEPMSHKRKFLGSVQARPTAHLIYATNAIPAFEDIEGAVERRLSVIPFNVSIPREERDPNLLKTLVEELPGIFNWALEAFRPIEVPVPIPFSECRASEDALQAHTFETHPHREFLATFCEPCPAEIITRAKLYEAYTKFCDQRGIHSPMHMNKFGGQVKRLAYVKPTLMSVPERENRVPAWKGIRILHEKLTEGA